MTEQQLRKRFEQTGTTMAKVESGDHHGVAISLGENLTRRWQSGDIIVFWTDGEHTVLPEDFELLELLWPEE